MYFFSLITVLFPWHITGLVHVSEMSASRVENASEIVNVGEQVWIKVIGREVITHTHTHRKLCHWSEWAGSQQLCSRSLRFGATRWNCPSRWKLSIREQGGTWTQTMLMQSKCLQFLFCHTYVCFCMERWYYCLCVIAGRMREDASNLEITQGTGSHWRLYLIQHAQSVAAKVQ